MPPTPSSAAKPKRITFARIKATGAYNAMPSYAIKVNGALVGHIQQKKTGQDSWFWYAGGRNTAAMPTTFEQAMRQSSEHLRSIFSTSTSPELSPSTSTPPDEMPPPLST